MKTFREAEVAGRGAAGGGGSIYAGERPRPPSPPRRGFGARATIQKSSRSLECENEGREPPRGTIRRHYVLGLACRRRRSRRAPQWLLFVHRRAHRASVRATTQSVELAELSTRGNSEWMEKVDGNLERNGLIEAVDGEWNYFIPQTVVDFVGVMPSVQILSETFSRPLLWRTIDAVDSMTSCKLHELNSPATTK